MIKDLHFHNETELPLVSVCIPAFNSELTLGETLEAVLAQDYPRLDIVVSDNQSTDRTRAIVEGYAQRGVRYCCHSARRSETIPRYLGASANWDYVLRQGRGDYVCLFHSDDLYEPSIVRRQVEVMQGHPNLGAVFTRMRIIGEDSRPTRMRESILPGKLRARSTIDFPTLLNAVLANGNFLPTPSVMLRRSVLDHVGEFDESRFSTSADLDMWLRIARSGYEIVIIDQPLLKFRISPGQSTWQYTNLRTTLADFFVVIDHYLSQPEVLAKAMPDAVALYKLNRAVDHVWCAMNLLVQERVTEAKHFLRQPMQPRHFVRAIKHPQVLTRLIVGAFFGLGIHLGLGTWFGKLVYGAYQRNLRKQRQPLSL